MGDATRGAARGGAETGSRWDAPAERGGPAFERGYLKFFAGNENFSYIRYARVYLGAMASSLPKSSLAELKSSFCIWHKERLCQPSLFTSSHNGTILPFVCSMI